MADNLRADLDQFLLQRRQRPILHWLGRRQRAKEVAEIVGESVKLKAHSVRSKGTARQARPVDCALPLLDPLLAGSALVVEGNDILGAPRHIRDNEADTWIKFADMPFDLGDHAARLRPASRLIAEVRVGSPDGVWRSSDGAGQQMANPFLKDAVCREPNGEFDPFGFEITVNLGTGEPRVATKMDA